MRKTVEQMVVEASRRVRTLSPQEVAAAAARGALLVDVREADELPGAGRIPGSVRVSRGVLEWVADPASALHDPLFDPALEVVLYCPVGGRSALAADALRQLGYLRVGHLEGGLSAWARAGLPLEAGSAG